MSGYDGGVLNGDGGGACRPQTCATLGFNCGPAGDGCGGALDCGDSCPSPQFCGGGGPSQCGGNVNVAPDGGAVCVPRTCGVTECGQKADGCGNLITCPATCTAPDTCGSSGTPFPVRPLSSGRALLAAASLHRRRHTTTLSGVVQAGVSNWLMSEHVTATEDPVPNVLVYIPNDPLPLAKMSQGYAAGACPLCSADVSGHPLVSTYTNFDGTFTLSNVPVGPSIPVVIQMGRWRRVFHVAVNASCGPNAAGTLNLPQNQAQGDIPFTAISTGNVDQLECVLLKMGIDPAEFTSNTANPVGRINLYGQAVAGGGNGLPGSTVAGSAAETTLMAAGGTLPNYDQLMLPCWGRRGREAGGEPSGARQLRRFGRPLLCHSLQLHVARDQRRVRHGRELGPGRRPECGRRRQRRAVHGPCQHGSSSLPSGTKRWHLCQMAWARQRPRDATSNANRDTRGSATRCRPARRQWLGGLDRWDRPRTQDGLVRGHASSLHVQYARPLWTVRARHL